MNYGFNSEQSKLLQLWFFSKSMEKIYLYQLFTETTMHLKANIQYDKAQLVYSKVLSIDQTLKRIRQLDTLIHEIYRYVFTIQSNSLSLKNFTTLEKNSVIKEKAMQKTVYRVLQYNSFISKKMNESDFILATNNDISINLTLHWSRLHLVLKVLKKRIEQEQQSRIYLKNILKKIIYYVKIYTKNYIFSNAQYKKSKMYTQKTFKKIK